MNIKKILILVLSIVIAFHSYGREETIQIEFTENDSYSIGVAHIDVGDTIQWLPKNEGHNVEFLVGPDISALPSNSKINDPHSILFKTPGVYLYGCTPHLNMGMLGLIVVGNDFHNLEEVSKFEISYVANSVLDRMINNAQPN